MALVQMGNIITEIRGKANGQIFTGNLYGNILRNKTKPYKGGSSKEFPVRVQQKFLSQSWLNLTPFVQGQWATFANNFTFYNKLGAPVIAKPNIVFNITQLFYFEVNGLLLNAPVGFQAPAGITITTIVWDVGSLIATVEFNNVGDPQYIELFVSAPYNLGKASRFKNRATRRAPLTLNPGGNITFDLSAEWWAEYPWATDKMYIRLCFRPIDASSFAWGPLECQDVLITNSGVVARPAVQDYIDRVAINGGLVVNTVYTIQQFITFANAFDLAAETGGWRSKIVRLDLTAFGADLFAKLTPFYFNQDGSATPIGFFETANFFFTNAECPEGAGRTSNGTTMYADTGVNPAVESVISLNSVGQFVWRRNFPSAPNSFDMGANFGDPYTLLNTNAGNDGAWLNSSANATVAAVINFKGAVRNNNATVTLYQNAGATILPLASTSEVNTTILEHAAAGLQISDAEYYLFMITDGTITDADVISMNTAFVNLFNAMGLP